MADPSLADPSLADPSLADPSLADPSLADPSLADPSLADPSLADPSLADPSLADPPLADLSAADLSVRPWLALGISLVRVVRACVWLVCVCGFCLLALGIRLVCVVRVWSARFVPPSVVCPVHGSGGLLNLYPRRQPGGYKYNRVITLGYNINNVTMH